MHRRLNFKKGDPACDEQEAQWMAWMAEGGPQASKGQRLLFMAYQTLFVTRLIYFGLSSHEADDVTQGLWIDIARRASTYRGDAPVRAFLVGFLKQARKNHFSKRRRKSSPASLSDEAVVAEVELTTQDSALSPEDKRRQSDFERCVSGAFTRFKRRYPRLAMLLMLKHVQELSLEEIARREGSKAERIKAEVFSARSKFRPDIAPCLSLWPNRMRGDNEQSR